ncbi:helix-turn-helix domain-containing protein [Shewanella sp. D64]|uniref:helix-turn-helix domain-containing protein n=1 Tax=unclassified Shewanella TaxID=196818 RepID=UPI0022BA6117|nr:MULTISPECIES: helix-turn-helix transcriptional regulator [unclassified Shewanella]MEC4727869.1 helix-turn-helix domain-containing protein [Shewanella sp. D64]MEC4739911.1 helix-turn-helix domain-containing protein [Shewanella sp. E94]WBJ97124.1 helix-turn-helix domain-containing protein [Shewanella sp. MTB7]
MDNDEVLKVGLAFGKAVKLRRIELGLNQEELADQADLARSFISGIERGVAKATVTSVWKLATALDCKPSDIWVVAERIYQSSRIY